MSDLKAVIREYVELLSEVGPVSFTDGSGMVDFTSPTTDADKVELEFDKNAFIDLTRRSFRGSCNQENENDIEGMADEIAMRYRRLMGLEIDLEDLEKELTKAELEDEEFQASSPEEKVRYYADPKWYTRFF